MPGWHAKTSELVQAGKLKVLGITQEQHPARTALFMQWHEMEWPVLLDSLNLLGCKSIPFTLLIDEHGIVRYQNPKDAELAAFMEAHYPKPEQTATPETNPTRSSPEGQLVWGGTAERNSAIESLTDRLKLSPNEATSHFRLGVAYRLRHDSAQAEKGDFEKAISSWKTALSIDPSQYIWRRRIQQYGPRLDKPYSFYDWVHQARKDITARGEIPHPLDAEPSGAEFAHPGTDTVASTQASHPDPTHQVPEDRQHLVRVSSVVVPSTDAAKPALRIHLTFTPDDSRKVHWTNDAGPLAFYLESEDTLNQKEISLELPPLPSTPASTESRTVEFEIRGTWPDTIQGSAYYYVCEDVNGTCLFLRTPVTISLKH